MRRVIKKVLLLVIILIGLWWLKGGTYITYDSSDLLIGKRISFNDIMVSVSPIPDQLMGDKISIEFKRAIIPASSQIFDYIEETSITKKKLDEEEEYIISNVLHLKVYGFYESAFRYSQKYFIVKNKIKSELYILFGEENVEFEVLL